MISDSDLEETAHTRFSIHFPPATQEGVHSEIKFANPVITVKIISNHF